VVKTILYERTIALGTSIEFRKELRSTEGLNLSLEVIAVDLGGGGRL